MMFWSVLLILQLIVLVLFLISMLLCIIAGVKMFLAAGCSAIYLLADDSICQGALSMLNSFLSSFWDGQTINMDQACDSMTLLTCSKLQEDFLQSVIMTTVGSILASVFSFQLIVES